jgi:hypothetical protein
VPEGFEFYEYKPRNRAPKNAKNQPAPDPPPPLASPGPGRASESIENQRALASASAGPPALSSRLLLSPTPLPEEPGLPTQAIAIRHRQSTPADAPLAQLHTGNLYDADSDIDAPDQGMHAALRADRRKTPSSPSTYQADRSAPSEHSGNSDRISRQSWHPCSDHTDTESSLDSDASSQHNTRPPSITALEHFYQHFSRGLFCPEHLHHHHFAAHEASLGKHGQSHTECNGLDYLRDLTDPKLPLNAQIPDLLSKPYVYRGRNTYDHSKACASTGKANLTPLLTSSEAADFRELFEGVRGGGSRPPNICLYQHEPRVSSQPPSITVDIDSICGFARSLAAFRQGIRWLLHTSNGNLIRGKIHGISIPLLDYENSERRVPVEKIPHLHIGSLAGWSEVQIYILFPAIYQARSRSKESTPILTDAQREAWYNLVFAPAIRAVLSRSELADFPPSFNAAQSNSFTASRERGSQSSSSIQLLRFYLQRQSLDRVWEEIQEQIIQNQLDEFIDARIFFNGKDFKGATSSKTYTELREKWQSLWGSVIDEDHLESSKLYWWDWGRQFAPPEGSSLLWKPCCPAYYRREKAKISGSTRLVPLVKYPLAGLRDTCSYTITPAHGSEEHRQGSIYSQFYTKSKTSLIVNAIEVLEDSSIDLLAYGQDQVRATSNAGGAPTASLATAAGKFVSGKIRAESNLHPSHDNRAVVLREEGRLAGCLSHPLLDRLVQSEQAQIAAQSRPRVDLNDSDAPLREQPNEPLETTIYEAHLVAQHQRVRERDNETTVSRHLPFWELPSPTFFGFLRGSLNKHLLGFEKHLTSMTGDSVPRSITASALLFLTAARYSTLSKQVNAERVLFKDTWIPPAERRPHEVDDLFDSPATDSSASEDETSQVMRHGLNMQSSMKRYGYTWWPSKVDWTTWQIKEQFVNHFFLDQPEFAQRFKRRQTQVAYVDHLDRLCDLIKEWLPLHSSNRPRLELILDFSIGLLMTQFRRDTWGQMISTKRLQDPTVADVLRSGRVPLTHANVSKYQSTGRPTLTTSNHSFYKNNQWELFKYLFGVDTYYNPLGKLRKRDHWEDKPYRVAFKGILSAILTHTDPIVTANWEETLFKTILATNPLLPTPDGTTFIQVKKDGQYVWATFDFPDGIGPLDQPASCKQVVKESFPSKATPIRTAGTTLATSDVFWSKPVPTLLFEVQYLGKEPRKVRRIIERQLAAMVDRE